MRRLDLRGRLTAVVFLAAAFALAVLTLGFNLVLRSSLDRDANQVLAGRASAALDTLSVHGGRVRAAEAPDSGAVDARVWIYSGSRAIERPPAPPAVQQVADRLDLPGGTRGYAEDPSTDTRLYGVPVVQGGVRAGTVVAGISLEPYERTASRALVGSLIFAGVVLLLIAATVRWVVGRALRPVARMTAEASAWSDRDLDRRFDAGDPRDELTRLAATFDRLLDRLAASLRRERSFSAELSHELRTPLSAIVAETDLALRRERQPAGYRSALEAIGAQARQLERTLDTLVRAARLESGIRRGTSDSAEIAERAAETCSVLASEHDVEIRVTPSPVPLRVGVDAEAGERILVPLLENACRYGRSRIDLEVSAGAGAVEFVVADDGSGVDPDESERIFEPGRRGSAGAGSNGSPGAGLGLSLARRLAEAMDGEVELMSSESGARFVARMPLG
jgi:signal transduction histidine kinase